MVAAALGYPEITAHLLARGAAVNAQDEKHTHALHAAALFAFQTNDTPRAKALIDLLVQHGASLNQPNDAGQNPLLLLLGASAKPGTKSDQKHLLAILPLLLSKGADLNAQDQRGVSALHACALHGLLLPARQLLAAGANPQCRDGLDRTPAELAQMLGYVDVATELAAVRPPALRPGAIQAKPSNP
jgi:ankyrin repeat protein